MQQPVPELKIRLATSADADIVSHHRARMFEDMGVITGAAVDALKLMSCDYFARTITSGEYVGWFAYAASSPETIVAGAGILLRTIPPFPMPQGSNAGVLAQGKQGLIINVYAEPAWRRRGLARMLMQEVMAFATRAGVESLVLHASMEGRPLYENLGFKATNEMRLVSS